MKYHEKDPPTIEKDGRGIHSLTLLALSIRSPVFIVARYAWLCVYAEMGDLGV